MAYVVRTEDMDARQCVVASDEAAFPDRDAALLHAGMLIMAPLQGCAARCVLVYDPDGRRVMWAWAEAGDAVRLVATNPDGTLDVFGFADMGEARACAQGLAHPRASLRFVEVA